MAYHCSSFFVHLVLHILINVTLASISTLNVQQDERIRLECTLTSKTDADEAMWMRIRSPYNPDILTYRGSVVYAPERIQLEQRLLTSNPTTNGTHVETYFLTLTILRPTVDDEGRYVCARGKTAFSEYDVYIIVPPHFINDHSSVQQRAVVEGSTLQLSCSANGRPRPSITWFYRSRNGKHIQLSDDRGCHDTICELHLGNYTRHDPSIIECIADNGKSTRVSKVFHIDVFYPPQLITYVRTLTGSRSMDIFLECSTLGNPLPIITWLDDNQEEIHNDHHYSIDKTNHSSILSFTIYPGSQSKVLYYCRSNNSLGTVEKLINISEYLQFESKLTSTTTTSRSSSITIPSTPFTTTTTTTTTTTMVFLSSNTDRLFHRNQFSFLIGFFSLLFRKK